MSNFIIEVGDDEVGIVVGEARSFRFFGVDARVRTLERLSFPSVEAATLAARAAIRSGRPQRPAPRRAAHARDDAHGWRQPA